MSLEYLSRNTLVVEPKSFANGFKSDFRGKQRLSQQNQVALAISLSCLLTLADLILFNAEFCSDHLSCARNAEALRSCYPNWASCNHLYFFANFSRNFFNSFRIFPKWFQDIFCQNKSQIFSQKTSMWYFSVTLSSLWTQAWHLADVVQAYVAKRKDYFSHLWL